MDIDDASESSRQVHVRFVTKLQSPYIISSPSISVRADLTRRGLSELVNNLIQDGNEDWKPEPFDFLVDGVLVRMSLEKFLLAKGVSSEKVIEVEYIKAVIPREEEKPSLHDDWVSAVDGSSNGYILTGCYDNLGRIWRAAELCSHVLVGHSAPITSVCVVAEKEGDVSEQIAATASKDRTLRLWKFYLDSFDQTKKIEAFKILRGHTASVQSIAANTSTDMICSGSWDCTVNLWNTSASDSDGHVVSVKKRRKDNKEERQSEGEALSTLVGHTQCVSAVVWPQQDIIYSASWDHSVRRWDVETGKECETMFSGKAMNCLDVGGESSRLIAAGASDHILRIWDPRKPGTSSPSFQLSSHNSWISSCKWHDKSWHHLASASYDGKVMVWDLRSQWPLAVIDSHKDKVLCVDWWRGDSLISGGVDSKLHISSGVQVQ